MAEVDALGGIGAVGRIRNRANSGPAPFRQRVARQHSPFRPLAAGRFHKTLWNTASILGEMLHFRAPHLKSEEFDVKSPLSFRLPQGAVIALGCCALLGFQAFLR